MKRHWGDKLVTGVLEDTDGEMPAPRDLRGRILVMVGFTLSIESREASY
jgi:hypothetical protein